jgi:drug/metabolite transporter (DMT)-like permease
MYAIGAQQNIAVTAVVASQMAPMAAVLAYFIFGERLGKGQIVGLVVILSGVTVLSFLQ